MKRKIVCIDCNAEKTYYALDRCSKCYKKFKRHTALTKTCECCKQNKQIYLRNQCKTCYDRIGRAARNNLSVCIMCKHRRVCVNNICKKCKENRSQYIECKKCKENKVFFAKNMCFECYKTEWSKTRTKETCSGCSQQKVIHYRDLVLCLTCYNKRIHVAVCYVCDEFKTINIRDNGKPVCLKCYNEYYRKKQKCVNCNTIGAIVDKSREVCLKCYTKIYNSNPDVIARKNAHLYKRRGWCELGSFNKDDWLFVMHEFNWKCFYCEESLKKGNRTIDHIEPITKNGAHEKWNIVPCCSTCNSSKNNKDLLDWAGSDILKKVAICRPKVWEKING